VVRRLVTTTLLMLLAAPLCAQEAALPTVTMREHALVAAEVVRVGVCW